MNRRIIIEAERPIGHSWREVWEYRDLLLFLTWRDILVRYKQTVVGIVWALLKPLATMVVFTIVFGKLAKMPSGDVPYPILVFAALLPWQLFANALTGSSASLVGNAGLISKVYFPRVIIPISSILGSLVEFLLQVFLLGLMMVWYAWYLNWRIVTLPCFMLIGLLCALGAGLWLGALNVKYRDFTHVVPFLVQFGLLISPVGFSSDVIPPEWRFWWSFNPMVGVIDGFRWCLLGRPLYLPGFYLSLGMAVVLYGSGIWYFRKTERTFADVI